MNSIQEIVQQALSSGYLTASMEIQVSRFCEAGGHLSVAEHQAVDQLMAALLSGDVITKPQKTFINVMEELVMQQALSCLRVIEGEVEESVDLGEITAYALNRLPPLYATTNEGAKFQREHAQEKLQKLILVQVNEAIANSIVRPDFHPERQALNLQNQATQGSFLEQVTTLLRQAAPVLQKQATTATSEDPGGKK